MPSGLAVGDRIELVEMPDDPDPIPVGEKGTVRKINAGPYPTLHVDWDSGRTLNLIVGKDIYKKI
jgi:hypothetical protein